MARRRRVARQLLEAPPVQRSAVAMGAPPMRRASDGPSLVVQGGAVAHAALLARADPVHRQALTVAIGRAHGNRYVQRLLADLPGAAARPVQRLPLAADSVPLVLKGSVGHGGDNFSPDVLAVQRRLEQLGALSADDATAERPDAETPTSVGEQALSATIAAVKCYQQGVLHYRHPDGRVDPDGKTLKALNAWQAAAQPATGAASGPTPAPATAEAPAPPAPTPTAPANSTSEVALPAVQVGGSIAGLAGKHPTLDAIIAKLADLATMRQEISKSSNEETGTQRQALVKGIGAVRRQIAGLDAGALGVDAGGLKAIQGQLHQRATALTPYYAQGANADILSGKGKAAAARTCNVTSIGMTLEGLGKTTGDFSGNMDVMRHLARYFAGKLGGAGGDIDPAGLRMPDFLQLVATYLALTESSGSFKGALGLTPESLNEQAGTDPAGFAEAVDKARALAASTIIFRSGEFEKFTQFFGVTATVKSSSYSDYLDEFGKITRGIRQAAKSKQNKGKTTEEIAAGVRNYFIEELAIEKAEDKVKEAEGKVSDKQLKKLQAALERKKLLRRVYEASESPAKMEEFVPLAAYKASITKAVNPLLAAGKQIIVSQYNHFVRLESIGDEAVVIDDPGQKARKNQAVSWAEARAIGLFLRYTVLE